MILIPIPEDLHIPDIQDTLGNPNGYDQTIYDLGEPVDILFLKGNKYSKIMENLL